MFFEKKFVGELEKCYAVAPLTWQGKPCYLVAAEKHAPCYLYDEEGNYLDTVWEEPGGVMTMVQLPGRDGEFLATHRFYSPNDSKEASLVYVHYDAERKWVVQELTKLPFLHRFDLLETEDACWLLACTLKSDHEYKDDWRFPGKVYAGIIPKDLSIYGEENPLPLQVLKEGMLKNHGYTRCIQDGRMTGIVSCENGIYQFFPPVRKSLSWKIEKLLDIPGSDALKLDLDGDGKDELFVISPFHGDRVWIFHESGEGWECVYEYPQKLEMLHAIDQGELGGKRCVIFGYRKQKRELLYLFYDLSQQKYVTGIIDRDCGPANVHVFHTGECGKILSANRETNEIAMYSLKN